MKVKIGSDWHAERDELLEALRIYEILPPALAGLCPGRLDQDRENGRDFPIEPELRRIHDERHRHSSVTHVRFRAEPTPVVESD